MKWKQKQKRARKKFNTKAPDWLNSIRILFTVKHLTSNLQIFDKTKNACLDKIVGNVSDVLAFMSFGTEAIL